jgi:hypothetical protein
MRLKQGSRGSQVEEECARSPSGSGVWVRLWWGVSRADGCMSRSKCQWCDASVGRWRRVAAAITQYILVLDKSINIYTLNHQLCSYSFQIFSATSFIFQQKFQLPIDLRLDWTTRNLANDITIVKLDSQARSTKTLAGNAPLAIFLVCVIRSMWVRVFGPEVRYDETDLGLVCLIAYRTLGICASTDVASIEHRSERPKRDGTSHSCLFQMMLMSYTSRSEKKSFHSELSS